MPFTPVQTLIGGLLLHLSTSSLLSNTGRVLGVSSVVDGAFLGSFPLWRWSIIAGLVSGPIVAHLVGLTPIIPDSGMWTWATQPVARLGLAGALIGVGSKLGSGCTSGHFLCGASRLSPRSLVATATFFTTAVITARLWPAPIHGDIPAYALELPKAGQGKMLVWTFAIPQAVLLIVGEWLSSKKASSASKPATTKSGSTAAPTSARSGELKTPSTLLRALPYALSGLVFSLGLTVSGMLSPLKVISFLRLLPPWSDFDPSLALVVVGGVIPNGIHYYGLIREARAKAAKLNPNAKNDDIKAVPRPRFHWEEWHVPTRKDIDVRLIFGALLFGAGWGLCGVCPGPAIASLGQMAVAAATGSPAEVVPALLGWAAFTADVVLGMAIVRQVDKLLSTS